MKKWVTRNILEQLARLALYCMSKEGLWLVFGFIFLLLSAASGSHHSIDPN